MCTYLRSFGSLSMYSFKLCRQKTNNHLYLTRLVHKNFLGPGLSCVNLPPPYLSCMLLNIQISTICIYYLDLSLFITIVLPQACNFIEKGSLTRVFTINFVKFLRTPFLQNTSGQLIILSQAYIESKQKVHRSRTNILVESSADKKFVLENKEGK